MTARPERKDRAPGEEGLKEIFVIFVILMPKGLARGRFYYENYENFFQSFRGVLSGKTPEIEMLKTKKNFDKMPREKGRCAALSGQRAEKRPVFGLFLTR